MKVGWKNDRLDSVVIKFIVPQRDRPKVFDGNVPWCRIEDIDGVYLSKSKTDLCVSDELIKSMPLRVYPVDTVIVSCSADLGRCAIIAKPLITNQTFIGLVPSEKINSLFLYYLMSSMSNQLNSMASGATIKYLSKKKFQELKIPIPPVEEQKEIVKILDNVFESIEKAKANIEKNIENAKELFQSKLNQIFSQNVEGWETKKFLDCLNKVKNTIKIPKRKFLNDGLYPIVSQESSLISGYWDNMNDLLNVEKPVIIFGDHTKTIKFIDFSFVRGADGIKVLLPIEQINSKFFYYLLRSVKLRDLGYARHYRLLKELVISYPTIEKQKKIVETLDIIDNHIQSLLVSYEEELKNLEELKKSILQKAFNGELTKKLVAA